jgi:hypothetical protein
VQGVAEEWEQLGRAVKGASEHAVKHTRVTPVRLKRRAWKCSSRGGRTIG